MEELKIPTLSKEEQRVLGSLLEKSKTTPEYYPITINALQSACNQKTSRKPVVNYDEQTITMTLDILKKKGLVSTVIGGGSRVTKYKHNLAVQLPLVPSELAIICLLLLRGPLTAGELNNLSGRLYEFETLNEVTENLEKLVSIDLIKLLPKQPGQKENRYIHLLGDVDFSESNEGCSDANNISEKHYLEDRVVFLENEVSQLKKQLQDLLDELH